jgi:hypothetical protein
MTVTDAPQAGARHATRLGELMRRFARLVTPLAGPLAGRRVFTIWALVRYRGRRSGRDYTTPIAIGVTPDTFVIPLPFAGAQWILNVMAAGECVIRWNGRDHHAVDPEVVDRAVGAQAFGPIPRFLLQFVGIDHLVRLRRTDG